MFSTSLPSLGQEIIETAFFGNMKMLTRLDSTPPPIKPGFHVGFSTFRSTNTGFPYGGNDGGLWQGRGANTAVLPSLGFEHKYFRIRLAPNFFWSENLDFQVPRYVPTNSQGDTVFTSISPYGGVMDTPWRFGSSGFFVRDWGQSELALKTWKISGGISSQQMWWGPGQHSSMLLSTNAGAFPYAFFKTDEDIDLWLFDLSMQIAWGQLTHSKFYQYPVNRNTSLLQFVLKPTFIQGLELGGIRVFQANADSLFNRGIWFRALFDGITKWNSDFVVEEDQQASIWVRLVSSDGTTSGYFEFARGDHSAFFRDFFTQPNHSRAYIVGISRLNQINAKNTLQLNIEQSINEASKTIYNRHPARYFYYHAQVRPGWTQNGQLLGAWYGTGGQLQTFSLDWFHLDKNNPAKIGLYAHRHVVNNDLYYDFIRLNPSSGNGEGDFYRHWVNVSVGGRGKYTYKMATFFALAEWTKAYNYGFQNLGQGINFFQFVGNDLVNWRFNFGVSVNI